RRSILSDNLWREIIQEEETQKLYENVISFFKHESCLAIDLAEEWKTNGTTKVEVFLDLDLDFSITISIAGSCTRMYVCTSQASCASVQAGALCRSCSCLQERNTGLWGWQRLCTTWP
ncbi:unnamed protein product, partial [Heterotrigona itama]